MAQIVKTLSDPISEGQFCHRCPFQWGVTKNVPLDGIRPVSQCHAHGLARNHAGMAGAPLREAQRAGLGADTRERRSQHGF